MEPLTERRITVSPGGCWLWTGGKAGAGYGVMYLDRKHQYAHRVSYESHVGPIPEGLEIDHLCCNKACVNPAHLEPVTHRENRRRTRVEFCHKGHRLPDEDKLNGLRRPCRRCDADRAARYRAARKVPA